jgi:hypothetical protein
VVRSAAPIAGAPIRRIAAPSENDLRALLAAGEPAVLTGAMADWPAFTKWTFDFLRDTVGERRVSVSTAGYGAHPAAGGKSSLVMETSRLLDWMTASDAAPAWYYMQPAPLRAVYPELAGDVRVPHRLAGGRETSLAVWFTRTGSISRLHYDTAQTFLHQVRGKKRCLLFSPDQGRRLYPRPLASLTPHMSDVDVDAPDYARHPRLQRARAVEHTLLPGEILFIPLYWWHQVTCLEASISVGFWWEEGRAFHWPALRLKMAAQRQQLARLGHRARALLGLGRKP